MTLRTLSSPMNAAVVGPITQPGYLVELQFSEQTVRLSTFGALTWNGVPWVGASMMCDSFDEAWLRARVTIFDPVAAYRTIALTGGGIRNRSVRIWKAYATALAIGDPVEIFTGVGDAIEWARGTTSITCARFGQSVIYAPLKRIGSATGFNFLAPPGTVINWGGTQITLGSR